VRVRRSLGGAEMLLSEGKFEPDTVPRIDGATLSAELLRSQGFREPMIARPVRQRKLSSASPLGVAQLPSIYMTAWPAFQKEDLSSWWSFARWHGTATTNAFSIKLDSFLWRWRWCGAVLQVSSIPGMEMPTGLTVEKISELVGPDVIMPVLDVGPQEELAMSLEAWVEVSQKNDTFCVLTWDILLKHEIVYQDRLRTNVKGK
jgi:hypothetical protein